MAGGGVARCDRPCFSYSGRSGRMLSGRMASNPCASRCSGAAMRPDATGFSGRSHIGRSHGLKPLRHKALQSATAKPGGRILGAVAAYFKPRWRRFQIEL